MVRLPPPSQSGACRCCGFQLISLFERGEEEREAGVLMAIAMFQPVTRGELTETFGKEISRDLIAALRDEGLIAAGPRSPKLGAPYAYVTTEKFLLEFGLESLRNLPDLEALKDAGLIAGDGRTGDGDVEDSSPNASDGRLQKGSPVRVI